MNASAPSAPVGTVYLLHLNKPYKHARHYFGWTQNLPRRLAQHRRGLPGARFMEVVHEAGITFEVARTRQGTRALERSKKGSGKAWMCPLCKADTSREGAQ